MDQWEIAGPLALSSLLLQATAGSFLLLFFVPVETGRHFFSTVARYLAPLAGIGALIAWSLPTVTDVGRFASILLALCVTVYIFGIMTDSFLLGALPHLVGSVAGVVTVWSLNTSDLLPRLHGLAGSLYSGAAVVGMIFGHWFIVRPKMSREPLLRLIVALFVLLAINGLLTAYESLTAGDHLEANLGRMAPFFWGHIVFGFGFTGIANAIALFCVREGSTQAATGFLFLAVAGVLIGELCRSLVSAATPLGL
ncbi:MAG: hypothetical protein NZ959_07525 [Armatimonadetes bacterium]|nr:hypothetical protein [Armatimonadota bacterium]